MVQIVVVVGFLQVAVTEVQAEALVFTPGTMLPGTAVLVAMAAVVEQHRLDTMGL